MTNLMSALRLERKRIEQAIRKLEHDTPQLGAYTRPDTEVIPIRRDILASDEDRAVADLAFDI